MPDSAAPLGWATARRDPKTLGRLSDALTSVFAERVSVSRSIREHHSQDEAYHAALPDLVLFPKTVAEVAKAVEICATFNCPIVSWGAGTSLEGNALAILGGACLNLSAMDRIVEVNGEDLTATVEPGVRRNQLGLALKHTGLFFPIDPGADASLGGMAATRASGTNAVKYGTMRDNVVCCTAVLADGRVIRTGRRAPKSAAGYDLTALLVGSEGTLGIITELTVRLHPLPEQVIATICGFETVEAAVQAVILAIQSGLGVARIELLDAPMMAAVNRFEKAHYPVTPTLFVEFHGSKSLVTEQAALFCEISTSLGGRTIQTATTPEERTALWRARHNALYASRASQPGAKVLITDVCVPISRLAECILETRADLDESSLTATIAGHVGDGNFHAFILVDPRRPEQIAEAEALHRRMGQRAISMNGTCTGEHGIGLGKRDLLVAEVGYSVSVMRAIKSALDPQNLLNPGKIFV
jgi:D-lactate dehydrogenase (cytochrome)